jgi:hypothetical protein
LKCPPRKQPTPDGAGWRWGSPTSTSLDVYAQGNPQPYATVGDSVRPSPASIYPTRHLVQLPDNDQCPKFGLLRVQTTSAINISARLVHDDALAQSMPRELFTAGLFVTLYLLSAGLYAVSAMVLRQAVQLAYSFYMLCLLTIFLGTQQPLLLNATLGSHAWANWVHGFGILMIPSAGSLLWMVILDLRRTHPDWFKAYACIILVCSLSLASINTPFFRVAALCVDDGYVGTGASQHRFGVVDHAPTRTPAQAGLVCAGLWCNGRYRHGVYFECVGFHPPAALVQPGV